MITGKYALFFYHTGDNGHDGRILAFYTNKREARQDLARHGRQWASIDRLSKHRIMRSHDRIDYKGQGYSMAVYIETLPDGQTDQQPTLARQAQTKREAQTIINTLASEARAREARKQNEIDRLLWLDGIKRAKINGPMGS